MKRFWFTAKMYSLMKSIGKFNRLLNVLGGEGGGVATRRLSTLPRRTAQLLERGGEGLTDVKYFSVNCFNNDRF